jgi:CBS domain containing-hemolysin-like protein
MADASAQHPAPSPATVADIMHLPVTTVNQNDHVAAAAYLMERAAGTALIVTQGQTGEPIGIITDADISRAVADGEIRHVGDRILRPGHRRLRRRHKRSASREVPRFGGMAQKHPPWPRHDHTLLPPAFVAACSSSPVLLITPGRGSRVG